MDKQLIIREATDGDTQTIKNMLRYAFEGWKNQYEDPEKLDPKTEFYPTKNYILEENNSIVATLGVISFLQQIRGTFVKMAGITGVACKPEHRRKGYMTQLFEYVFKVLKEQEFLVSTLYPFSFSFYESLGYGQADSLHVYTVKCSEIVKKPTPNRKIIEDYDRDYSRCHPLYDAFVSQLDGLVKRDASVWKFMDGWNWRNKGYQFICQDVSGRDLGYMIVRFEKQDERNPFPFLLVREMVYFDSETKQAFLNFLADHDSQMEYVKFAPFEQNYLLYFKSPRIKENTIIANSMLRIIILEKLLTEIKYPNDINEVVTLQVDDPNNQCPWNNKKITLKVQNGRGEILTASDTHIIRLGIKELSQVVIGFYDAFELFEIGKIAGDKLDIAKLSHIFPKQNVALREYF